LIKNFAMDMKSNREMVLEKLTKKGIEPTRIKFRGYTKNRYDHLKVYKEVDLTLDSFPYNGTTTNCESFVMGVPVLTRVGKDHRSRVGASQLTVLNLEELITSSEDEYVAKAVALAGDRARLAMLSKGLREKMLSSPLMDAQGFTRDLESAYRQIWMTWCKKQHTRSCSLI
jgi:predicted O-linked N-acetylglucosamine transferase (SPINDLY family)